MDRKAEGGVEPKSNEPHISDRHGPLPTPHQYNGNVEEQGYEGQMQLGGHLSAHPQNTQQVKDTTKEQYNLRQHCLPIHASGRSPTNSDRGSKIWGNSSSSSEVSQCNKGDEVPRVEVRPSIFRMICDSKPPINEVSLLKTMQIFPNSPELQPRRFPTDC